VVQSNRNLPGGIGVLTCCAAAALAMMASPAAASAAPIYSINVIEGSTTSPSYSESGTYGYVNGPAAESRITITHAGAVVAENTGPFAIVPQVPQVGDVVTLESPPKSAGSVSITYDGLPTMDATVCAGSSNFTGQRDAAFAVQGGFFTLATTPYHGEAFTSATAFGTARVTALAGSSFAGSFPSALTTAQTVYASQEQKSTLPGGATLEYFSENERPVGACPAAAVTPAVIAAPPAKLPALKGALLKLTLPSILKLLKSGWLIHVSINQPGTVIQDLYLQNGKLPAQASRHEPAATLVARGATTAKKAGTVTVHVRVNTKGRRALKHLKHAKLVLITTLRSSSGVRISLGHRALSLKR
jgi:hypothetical protein